MRAPEVVGPPGGLPGVAGALCRSTACLPVHAYRYTLKPIVGWECRHVPSCSEFALEAIALNGAWRGLWQTAGRLSRCRPGGTAGLDLVPDQRGARAPFAPWRYGRWR